MSSPDVGRLAADRAPAWAGAAACLALVAAQYVWPAWLGFHTWQYALALVLAVVPVARHLLAARRRTGRRWAGFAIALAGALIVAIAGLASGVLGPDTQTVARAPGTVAPLPDLGAAAFFPNVDAPALARADARIVLRRRNARDLEVGSGERLYFGAAALTTEFQTAVYVEGRNLRGERITVTQPVGAAFLSPILLFPERVTIAGQALPADTFAAPAVHRQVRAFYFSKDASRRSHRAPDRDAVLFAVDDESGKPVARSIAFAVSGQEVELGGLRLRPTLGRYPALVVSAVPYPAAVWLGGLLFAGGLAYGYGASHYGLLRRRQAVSAGQ